MQTKKDTALMKLSYINGELLLKNMTDAIAKQPKDNTNQGKYDGVVCPSSTLILLSENVFDCCDPDEDSSVIFRLLGVTNLYSIVLNKVFIMRKDFIFL